MNRASKAIALTLAALGALSCSDGGRPAAETPKDPTVIVHPAVEGPPVAAEGEVSAGRGVRRMKLAELEGSVPVVAGEDDEGEAIQWSVQKDGKTVSGFNNGAFGHVLGRPDYVNITEESKAPSSLELKFIRDMARNVCDRMLRADLARDPAAEKTLLRYASVADTKPAAPADVAKNVQYLVLRFHGLRLGLDDPQLLALVKLYESARDATDHPELHEVPAAAEGWRAVCIALFEDPAFYLD